jgi:hypothetical protein
VKIFKNTDVKTQASFKAELDAGFMNLAHPNLSRLLGYGCSQLVENDLPSGTD